MKRYKAMHKLREFLSDRKVSSIDTLGVLSHSILRFVEDELGMLPPNRLVDTDERDHTWDDVEDSDA